MAEPVLLDYDEFESPIGRVLFASDAQGICALDYADFESRMAALLRKRYGTFRFRRGADPFGLRQQLRDYFDGKLNALDATPVATGGTPFQIQVWKALREIPPGHTRTYGELALRLGRDSAARAVGHANALNPVAIILPCHRVIGASSGLTGYAGGLERKWWLLQHEKAQGMLVSFPYSG
jgi:methylated-DNA-[protein]-cysteine S-methyltransferase